MRKNIYITLFSVIVVAGVLIIKQGFNTNSSARSGSKSIVLPTLTSSSLVENKSPCESGNSVSVDVVTYENTPLGFSLKLPAGWAIPSEDDSNPVFVNCDSLEKFEISSTKKWNVHYPENSKTVGLPNQLIKEAQIEEVHPYEDTDPDHKYYIEFKDKTLSLIVDRPIDQYSFVSTLKLRHLVPSYGYLFYYKPDSRYSNIVGYFSGGAFIWYVPGWLYGNWHQESLDASESFHWVPNIREDPNVFSNIEFYVATSTKTFNAAHLYEMDQSNSLGSYQVKLKEVLMNKTSGTNLVLPVQASTRIYHVVRTNFNGSKTDHTYYLDGGDKTLTITFTADSDVISQFENNIQDMVEHIGGIN